MSDRHTHDHGFFVWALAGFLCVFGFVTGFTIGLPILFVGLIWFVYLLFRGPLWPAELGLLAGIGSVSLLFAGIAAFSGEYSPSPWAGIGFLLVGSSSALYWQLVCRPGR